MCALSRKSETHGGNYTTPTMRRIMTPGDNITLTQEGYL